MLDGIRKASKNWLGRAVLTVIMGILVLSFAIWGIGDMLRVTGPNYVARVGKVDITADQMRNAYNTTLEETSQRLRRRLTNEEARLFGLDKQVLGKLVSEAALDQKVRGLGLNLSDEEVVRQVMNEPSLKTSSGQFDRARFADILRQNGLTEAGFFAEQKRSVLRRQLSQAIAGDTPASDALVGFAHQYLNEQREVKFFILPAASVGDVGTPDEAALKQYYETRKADFRAPEYRKVNVLAAEPDKLGIDLTVTDADLRRVYDRAAAAGQLGAPPKRQVSQILYPNEQEANAAFDKIKAGASFESLLEERKIKPADADLGLKTQREFADAAIAAIAFATAEGQVAPPIKTAFGSALIKVTKADAGSIAPFEQVKGTLTATAQSEKLRSDPRLQAKLDEISRKVEDARTAGKSLAEAAPLAGLTLATIDAVDATGKDKAGNPVPVMGGEETLKGFFQSDIGLDNEAIRPRTGGLIWFEIAGVESARDRPYDEVKGNLLAAWKVDEAAKRLTAKANDLVARLDKGEDFGAVAKSAGVDAGDTTVQRSNGGAIGNLGAAQAFAVAVGKAAQAQVNTGDRVVLQVTGAKTEPLNMASSEVAQTQKQLGQQISEDLIQQYIAQVQKDLGTSVNQKALATALGGGGS
jgi:peptidyl-prolyl cis-trans isomerase D